MWKKNRMREKKGGVKIGAELKRGFSLVFLTEDKTLALFEKRAMKSGKSISQKCMTSY